MVENTKPCTKCKQERDLSEFYPDKRSKDGKRSHCRFCCLEYGARRYQENQTEQNEYFRLYAAKHRDRKRELNRQCYARTRDKRRASSRAYQAAHREENKQRCRAWQKANLDKCRARANRRRARKAAAGGEHTAADLQRQGECQKWRCWWCGNDCRDKWHEDHLVPLAKGGHNGPSNIVIACPSCNLSKHDSLPDEWAGKLL